MPENLIARRAARDAADDDIAAAQSACKALLDEENAARAALAAAEGAARSAALAVMFAEAERIAARLEGAKREVWRLANSYVVWADFGRRPEATIRSGQSNYRRPCSPLFGLTNPSIRH